MGQLGGGLGTAMGVMIRYQDSPALIVLLVIGYLGLIYCALLIAQQRLGQARLVLPKIPQWFLRRFRNPTSQFMEDEL